MLGLFGQDFGKCWSYWIANGIYRQWSQVFSEKQVRARVFGRRKIPVLEKVKR